MSAEITLADPRFTEEVVDGQRLYVPSEALVCELLEQSPLPTIGGRRVGVGRIFAQFAQLAQQTPGVRVALGDAREKHQPFIVYHLVRVDGKTRRVVLEGQTCFECGWRGMTGNARDLALYEGTETQFELVRAALSEPSLICPTCHHPLTRACVFVHTVAEGRTP